MDTTPLPLILAGAAVMWLIWLGIVWHENHRDRSKR